MLKLKLNELKVQSFITVLSGNNPEHADSGSKQGTWEDSCQTEDPCNTFDDDPLCN